MSWVEPAATWLAIFMLCMIFLGIGYHVGQARSVDLAAYDDEIEAEAPGAGDVTQETPQVPLDHLADAGDGQTLTSDPAPGGASAAAVSLTRAAAAPGEVIADDAGRVFVYSGPPALGNLVSSYVPENLGMGTDAFGNHYLPGITDTRAGTGDPEPWQLQMARSMRPLFDEAYSVPRCQACASTECPGITQGIDACPMWQEAEARNARGEYLTTRPVARSVGPTIPPGRALLIALGKAEMSTEIFRSPLIVVTRYGGPDLGPEYERGRVQITLGGRTDAGLPRQIGMTYAHWAQLAAAVEQIGAEPDQAEAAPDAE